jgi:cobalamin biosynthesis protein CbiG
MSDDSRGGPAPLPVWTRSGLVAGIGLRASATSEDILELLDFCLSSVQATRSELVGLVTADARSGHAQLLQAARLLDLPLAALSLAQLDRPVPNPSPRVRDRVGVPSVAEASALAYGPLVLAKQRSSQVTCALSRYTLAETSSSSRASSASSTLATSSAGP